MKYRPEIDGLRTVAVVPVILFHADFDSFAGGFVGVDVFFVISGYLITLTLLQDLQQNRFSILSFYERRARRILPALFFVMAAFAPLAWAWMTPGQLLDYGRAVLATVFFVSNVLFWRQVDYFAPASELNPLLHTWSLAVEEQYYLGFPLLLWLLWRLASKNQIRVLAVVFAGLALLSLGLAEWGWRNVPGANFYLIPTRAWELLAGSLCALMLKDRVPFSNDLFAGGGLLMILGSVLLFDDATPFPSLWALLPVVGTVLLILSAGQGSKTAWLLSLRPMVALGLISYSAYLWHQPLFAFARLRSLETPSVVLMLSLSLVSLVLAALTWRFVEQPFRQRRGPGMGFKINRNAIFAASIAGAAVLSVGAGTLLATKGAPWRATPAGPSFAALDIDQRLRGARGLPLCTPGSTAQDGCPQQPEIALWGDSFAMHLYDALLTSESVGPVVQQARPACAPILGLSLYNKKYTRNWAKDCIAFNDQFLEWLQDSETVRYVVLSSPMGILNERVVTREGQVRDGDVDDVVAEALRKTAAAIRKAGASPIFVTPPPRTGENLASCPAKALVFGGQDGGDCSFALDEVWDRDTRIRSVLTQARIDMPVLLLDDLLCPDGRCRTLADGAILYRDSGHLSYEGSEWLGRTHDLAGLVRAMGG